MKTKKKIFILKSFIAISIFGLVLYIAPYYQFLSNTVHISLWKMLPPFNSIKKYNNQTNILILGIAGGNRPGDNPKVSDSIIVTNYNFSTNRLTTISVPRDIWSDTLKNKINSAYAEGETKAPGKGGFILAKAELESVIGMPIQYTAVIDFNKFKELINFLGGIEINVVNSFTDNLYPIAGRENDDCGGDTEYRCRYETIFFNKGPTFMNGDMALKFVRSRHAEGNEGSDFAREKRQQLVIAAIKNKLINIVKIHQLDQMESLYNLLDQIILRDITNQQTAEIVKNIFFKGNLQQNTVVLTEDFFEVPDYNIRYKNQWVLIPKGNNFSLIQNYINCKLNNKLNCEFIKLK